MDLVFSSILLILSLAVWAWILGILKPKSTKVLLPPGPKPYPIIGNILELGEKPHQSLAKLSQVYGPLIHLKLGSLTTVVVSSPGMAKIFLQKNDQVFSSRIHQCAAHALDHHKLSMAWLPVDKQWRKLRKICKEEMFSVPSLDSTQGLRRDRLQKLCEYVHGCCIDGKAVDIGRAAFTTSLNLMSATLFSEELAAFDSGSCEQLKEVVRGIMECLGKPNLADYFPVFKVLDVQGILRKNTVYFRRCFDIFEEIIGKRIEMREGTRKNDMLYGRDLFVAGTDTTSSTVEWTMSELLRHPTKMLKLKNELREVIVKNKQVTESDISRLPYLRAVVKEIFRLHPAAPLLAPHKPDEDVGINGYTIPRNAQILINAWAIGRDSGAWFNPESFTPERFLENEMDFKGQHFELIPFGAGRRICPGLPLANRMVHLMVATLVHYFDWELDGGLKPQELDMNESFGLTLQKTIPLKAIPCVLELDGLGHGWFGKLGQGRLGWVNMPPRRDVRDGGNHDPPPAPPLMPFERANVDMLAGITRLLKHQAGQPRKTHEEGVAERFRKKGTKEFGGTT
ncbi:cytochrome P450 76T24-like [Henckelia pumila]|uniref:cytochrome P450 76T24-like n=1 Tax=Henckelia pumila TaxID=405737 RepID=UPI003C6DF2A7